MALKGRVERLERGLSDKARNYELIKGISQMQYSELEEAGKLDRHTFYVIGIDLSGYPQPQEAGIDLR